MRRLPIIALAVAALVLASSTIDARATSVGPLILRGGRLEPAVRALSSVWLVAQQSARNTPRAVSHEVLTISTSVVQLGNSTINPAGSTQVSVITSRSVSVDVCAGSVEGGSFRFWTDGSTPTSTVGRPVPEDAIVIFDNRADIARFKGIRDSASATDATFTVECSR